MIKIIVSVLLTFLVFICNAQVTNNFLLRVSNEESISNRSPQTIFDESNYNYDSTPQRPQGPQGNDGPMGPQGPEFQESPTEPSGTADTLDDYNKTTINSTNDNLEIYIFGNGGLRTSALGAKSDNNTVNGALGASFILSKVFDLTLGYSINDTKSVSIGDINDFGTNILIPDMEGTSFSLNSTYFFKPKIAANFEFQMASSVWEIDDKKINSSPMALKLNALYAPFGNLLKRGDNYITLTFSCGYSMRALVGGIEDEQQLLMEQYNTSRTLFHGFEFGANLVINQTKLFMNIPIFKSDNPIEGLTGTSVTIGATISGEFLKL